MKYTNEEILSKLTNGAWLSPRVHPNRFARIAAVVAEIIDDEEKARAQERAEIREQYRPEREAFVAERKAEREARAAAGVVDVSPCRRCGGHDVKRTELPDSRIHLACRRLGCGHVQIQG